MKRGVLLVNFGGPRGPAELVPFLTELLDDVLPLPWPIKRPVAALVARLRARKVRSAYESIGWSPIVPDTLIVRDAVKAALGPDTPIAMGMLFTSPTLGDAVKELVFAGVDDFVVITMFPHDSQSTVGGSLDRAKAAIAMVAGDRPIHAIRTYHVDPAYIEALGDTIREGAKALPGEGPIHLLFSPHGLPESYVARGDRYPDEIRASVAAVVKWIGWTDPVHIGWQSRVGPAKWIRPSTIEVIDQLGDGGASRVLAVPISFTGEHIETLYEIDVELAEHARGRGIEHFGRAKAVGAHPAFIRCLVDAIRRAQ